MKAIKKLTKAEKTVITLVSLSALVFLGIFGVLLYVNDYYRATQKANLAIFGNEEIEVTEEKKYYFFDSPSDEGKGIIFYQGGKVDEVAYAPLLLRLAEAGYDVYLVKMPARLAILGANAARPIMDGATHIDEWTIMGHSLGGSMAADFAGKNREDVDNLVLLASYSMEDLSDSDIDVYSFYGTMDRVLNKENYDRYLSLLPADRIEKVIEGGNHAYFGNYGEQEGDGTATITREEQQEIVLDVFLTLEKEQKEGKTE